MEYKHFSHQHPLILHKIQTGEQFQCNGCNLLCVKDSIYTCWSCKFFLHEHCGNANRYVNHPSHPTHPLVLVPSPTYCSGAFMCDACGSPGTAFSYSCPLCEVDLHINCAFLPPAVIHNAHHHEVHLGLTPEKPHSPDCCKLCRKELSCKYWSYACEKPECDFRVHTFCATSEVRPGFYQDNQPENQTPAVARPAANQTPPQEAELTPEEIMLGIAQMKMEYNMAQALANMIAYNPY
ncbi:hypothetical protein ACP275_10G181900 [Erythranthe tilingii]